VLVVRGQQFTPPQFIAAAQVFGELFQHDKREMHVRAGQAVLHFARYAAGVNMVVREDSLSLYMSEYLIERIRAEPKVKVLLNTEVTALHGGDHLERITVRSRGEENTLPARALFLMIGASPNTGWLSDLVELDSRGFVKTGKTVGADRPFETSRQGIFAIGDVRAGSVKRVASAAGEGSVVVPGIYEFLGDPSRHWDPLHLMSSSSTNFSEVA